MRFRAGRLLALALLAAAGPGACSLLDGETEVPVVPPSLPPALAAVLGEPTFRLGWAGGEPVECRDAGLGGPGVGRLGLPPGRYAVVWAEPLFGGAAGLVPPAGGLYPDQLDAAGILRLSWIDGWSAALLRRLAAAGFGLTSFNCSRFFAEARRRSGGDPWCLDQDAALGLVGGLSFRADALRRRPAFAAGIPPAPPVAGAPPLFFDGAGLLDAQGRLPAGRWLSWNPLAPEAETGADGRLDFSALSAGAHRFYHEAGIFGLAVQVGGDGVTSGAGFSLR